MKRRMIFAAAAFAAVLGLVGLAEAQRGGGFGGGQGFRLDPIQLLNNASVKKELEFSDEQAEKLPDAIRKALAEVLTDKQAKRLSQIELQQRGLQAFGDKKVASDLKLSDDQQTAIKTIITDNQKEMAELRGGGGGGFGKGNQEKIQTLRKEAMEKAQDVLTADQKKQWTVMTGEPFKIEFPAGGGGFGNFKKKKAAE